VGTAGSGSAILCVNEKGARLRVWERSPKVARLVALALHGATARTRKAAARKLAATHPLRYRDIQYKYLELMVFSGDCVHAGLEYDELDFRLHCASEGRRRGGARAGGKGDARASARACARAHLLTHASSPRLRVPDEPTRRGRAARRF